MPKIAGLPVKQMFEFPRNSDQFSSTLTIAISFWFIIMHLYHFILKDSGFSVVVGFVLLSGGQ